MTRRKIALWIVAVMTLALTVLRIEEIPGLQSFSLLGMDIAAFRGVLVGITAVTVFALCLSRKTTSFAPQGKWNTPCGWITTFCGAVMALTAVTDLFAIGGTTDIGAMGNFGYILFGLKILFEVLGGVYLVFLGFCWMSKKPTDHTVMRWMALCPALWMWLRLACYEISYASTIDIGKSFFDFATMVFASLFLLQFARAMAQVGKPPKSSLLIFALCTALVSISAIPCTLIHLSQATFTPSASVSDLMTVIVDGVVGLTALIYAAMQVFTAPADVEAVSAWDDPEKPHEPLEPPFSPDRPLPVLETAEPIVPAKITPKAVTEAPQAPQTLPAEEPAAQPSVTDVPSIDDLLSEIKDAENLLK